MLTFLGGKRWAFLSVCFILRSNAFMTTEYKLTNDIIDSEVICWLFLCDYCKSRAAQFLTVSAVKTKKQTRKTPTESFLKPFFLYFCSENAQNVSCPVTVVHGRRFHHAHAQTTGVKTAAQR